MFSTNLSLDFAFCKGLQAVLQRLVTFGLLSWCCFALSGCQTASTYNGQGVDHFKRGDYQSAVDNFQDALAVNPHDADAYYNLAATLHERGRQSSDQDLLDQAESLYHRCLDLNDNHVDCYRALAVLLTDTDRTDSAFTLLERWAQRSPQLSEARVELARLHEEFGEPESARQYLAQALDINATDSRAWAAFGRLREREGRYADALTNYQHAYNLNRNHPGITQRIASLQTRIAQARPGGIPNSGAGGGTRMARSEWRNVR